MTLKKWLCIGNKKNHSDKCLFCKVEVVEKQRPRSARSEIMINYQELEIFCIRYVKFINKYVTECSGYATNTLGDFIK